MTPAPVILVHGLWMTPGSFAWMRRGLGAGGEFAAHGFGYGTRLEHLDAVVDRLAALAHSLPGDTVHFIGHSLGGIVLLRLLERHADLPRGRFVLLGSPVNGSLAARAFTRFPLGSRLLGRATSRALLDTVERCCTPGREVGVIAGSQPLGLGRIVAHFDEPNDGTVAVRETRLRGAADSIVLPVSHLGMMVSRGVLREVKGFLHSGGFSAGARRSLPT